MPSALLLAAHARWHEAAARATAAAKGLAKARADADRGLADLQAAETTASSLAAELAARAAVERERRLAYEAIRAELTALQLREARLTSDREALDRDRARLELERDEAMADLAERRRELASPAPQRSTELEQALGEAEGALADALAEEAAARDAGRAESEHDAAVRRAAAARVAELDGARRRAAEARRRADDQQELAAQLRITSSELDARLQAAAAGLHAARDLEATRASDRHGAQRLLSTAEAHSGEADQRLARIEARLASTRGALDAVRTVAAEEEARGIGRAARRRGGHRLDDGLEVDAGMRPAVEAALGDAARAYVVGRDAVLALSAERGVLAVQAADAGARGNASAGPAAAHRRGLLEVVARHGGGPLAVAIRRDPTGAAVRLLETAVWLPDLGSALAVQKDLPGGWIAVTRDGTAVIGSISVNLGRSDGPLERRAEEARLAAEHARLESEAAGPRRAAEESHAAVEGAREAVAGARGAEVSAVAARNQLEAAQRVAGREAEAAARELAWQGAQEDRLVAEADRLADVLGSLESDATSPGAEGAPPAADSGSAEDANIGTALHAWGARARELRAQRDRLADELAEHEGRRRETEGRLAQSAARATLDEQRLANAERELASITERLSSARAGLDEMASQEATLAVRETDARRDLEAFLSADTADRDGLAAAEQAAAAARERLRHAEDGLRRAEVTDLEGRLGQDSIREQVLVELAGLGELGLRGLREQGDSRSKVGDMNPDEDLEGAEPPARAEVDEGREADDEAAALEAALARVAPRWAAERPPGEPPTPGRLAALRRRYHELGAANPFAVEEYQELKTRLEGLEGQRADLTSAIDRTRALIDELSALISGQFEATFRALEAAFNARFRGLFGGGFARLVLTDPEDLSATGVEIVARPPGKKTQALAMLSGGERALTAVALLFAMLEVRPVPFCVLDEVDAALDESNIGRFTEALRSLANETQFIVITHNRGTIEAADALYGVTVGDDSVSRVISLRLDEATALADEGRSAGPTNGQFEVPAVRA